MPLSVASMPMLRMPTEFAGRGRPSGHVFSIGRNGKHRLCKFCAPFGETV
jgi:hypothetical protein